MTSKRYTRRNFLRGAGVALALPWLETPWLWAADPIPRKTQPPRRFACLFMANGVEPGDWGSTGDGKDMVLKKSLQPLERLKEDLVVLNGLYNPKAANGNIHIAAASALVSAELA